MYRNSQQKVSCISLFKMLFAVSLPIFSLVSPMTAIAQPAPTIIQSDPVVQLVHVPALSASFRKTYRPYSELAKTDRTEQLWRDSDYAGATVALTKSGKVYAWGNNIRGHVGNGTTCTLSSPGQYDKKPPCYYDQPQNITKYFGNDKVTKLASNHVSIVVALTTSGKLYYWGRDWDPVASENVVINQPTTLDTLSPYRVTGFGGHGAGFSRDFEYFPHDAWYAYNDDTLFLVGGTGTFLSFSDDAKHVIKPKLDGATIKQVDYVDTGYTPGRNGTYILTSKNKLFHLKFDGSTTEVTNDKIKSRGGVKQIFNHYAIDHQGGLWFYGYGENIDPVIQDMSQKTIKPLPIARDLLTYNYDTVILGADNRIYNINVYRFDENKHFLNTMMVKSMDITTLISKERVKLLNGGMSQRFPEDVHILENYYDYSFTPESQPDTVCTGLSGIAANDFNYESEGENPPKTETTRPVNGTLPTTCVKMPPVTVPVPVPAPTPTQPAPGAPDFTAKRNSLRAPNTGSQ